MHQHCDEQATRRAETHPSSAQGEGTARRGQQHQANAAGRRGIGLAASRPAENAASSGRSKHLRRRRRYSSTGVRLRCCEAVDARHEAPPGWQVQALHLVQQLLGQVLGAQRGLSSIANTCAQLERARLVEQLLHRSRLCRHAHACLLSRRVLPSAAHRHPGAQNASQLAASTPHRRKRTRLSPSDTARSARRRQRECHPGRWRSTRCLARVRCAPPGTACTHRAASCPARSFPVHTARSRPRAQQTSRLRTRRSMPHHYAARGAAAQPPHRRPPPWQAAPCNAREASAQTLHNTHASTRQKECGRGAMA